MIDKTSHQESKIQTDESNRLGKLIGDAEPFACLPRKHIIKFVDLMQDVCEISWITTDKNSFEWVEVNQNKRSFMNKFSSLAWSRVCLGLYNSSKKSTRYIVLEAFPQ